MTTQSPNTEDARWADLARHYHLRLPRRDSRMSVRRAWTRSGLSVEDFYEWSGFKRTADFKTANPDWTPRAICGLALEYRAEKDGLGPYAPYAAQSLGTEPML